MKMIDTKDVLLLCKFSNKTLKDLLDAGSFPTPIVFGKRKRRWREDDVVAWMMAQ